jgi:glycosyltransferase involved in cell wall biosynthesis
MKVLILHSRYRSGETSGENRVVADEATLLAQAGHDVVCWDPEPDAATALDQVQLAARAVWSFEATDRVRRLLHDERPDVVHCHNLFPNLSPAVIRTVATGGVPCVVTLHNFRLLCLPATLLRDGEVCEDCVGHVPWRGVVHRCYRGSAAGSAALAVSLTAHRVMATFRRAALFVAVSQFIHDKFVAARWPSEQITVKSNFAWPAPRRQGPGEYFLYLGRLSPEKGLADLLRAWPESATLLVVGSGPLDSELRALAPGNVEFPGAVPASAVGDLVARARAVVLPSRCYEGQPRSVLEAYAAGVPVVASDRGGLPECVVDGETGLLVGDDAQAWRDAVRSLQDDEVSKRLGAGAFARWERHYAPQPALEALEGVYARALGGARPVSP